MEGLLYENIFSSSLWCHLITVEQQEYLALDINLSKMYNSYFEECAEDDIVPVKSHDNWISLIQNLNLKWAFIYNKRIDVINVWSMRRKTDTEHYKKS